ncbi:MAG: hypothetical protein ACO2ZD_00650 [Pseudomonadales bacterium]
MGGFSYDPLTGTLTHTSSNGTVQTGQVSLADGFLESVEIDPGNPNAVIFTWNTDSGLAPTTIDFSHLDNGLVVGDTDCIDMSITGAGTAVDPWVINATPVIDPNPDNALSCTATGLFAAATVVQELDTDCIDLTVSGTGVTSDPYVISATPVIDSTSADAVDNVLQCTADGLIVNWRDVEAAIAAEPFDCSSLPAL